MVKVASWREYWMTMRYELGHWSSGPAAKETVRHKDRWSLIVVGALEGMEMEDVRHHHSHHLLSTLAELGLEKSTQNQVIGTAKLMFQDAVERGFSDWRLGENPFALLSLRREPRKVARWVPYDRLTEFTDRVCESLRAGELLSQLMCGLRVGEVGSLCWGSVIDTPTLSTPAVMNLDWSKTKGAAQRLVPLPVEVSSRMPRRGRDEDFVWPNRTKDPAARALKGICEEMGIDVNLHGLRHTFARYMYFVAGMQIGELADLLGHTSHSTTAIYLRGGGYDIPDKMAGAAAGMRGVEA